MDDDGDGDFDELVDGLSAPLKTTAATSNTENGSSSSVLVTREKDPLGKDIMNGRVDINEKKKKIFTNEENIVNGEKTGEIGYADDFEDQKYDVDVKTSIGITVEGYVDDFDEVNVNPQRTTESNDAYMPVSDARNIIEDTPDLKSTNEFVDSEKLQESVVESAVESNFEATDSAVEDALGSLFATNSAALQESTVSEYQSDFDDNLDAINEILEKLPSKKNNTLTKTDVQDNSSVEKGSGADIAVADNEYFEDFESASVGGKDEGLGEDVEPGMLGDTRLENELGGGSNSEDFYDESESLAFSSDVESVYTVEDNAPK